VGDERGAIRDVAGLTDCRLDRIWPDLRLTCLLCRQYIEISYDKILCNLVKSVSKSVHGFACNTDR
jgi:hypothetical protein